MKRIDFLGAPGVGKSTINKQLINSQRKSSSWITPKEAELKLAREYLDNIPNKNKKELLAKIALSNALFEPLRSTIVNKIINRIGSETIWANREKNNEFLNQALLGACIEEKDPIRRLMGINWFFDVVKTVAVVENSDYEDIVLFDESLSQKVYGVTYHDKELEIKEIEMYFKLTFRGDGSLEMFFSI